MTHAATWSSWCSCYGRAKAQPTSTSIVAGRSEKMKTMTCKQMGGPCEVAFQGKTADEVIKAEDKHLKEMVATGDETHQGALKTMQGRWRNPISGIGWYMK